MPKKFDLKSEGYYLVSRREGVESMHLSKYFELTKNSKTDGGWTTDSATYLAHAGKPICESVTRIREALIAKRPLLLRKPDLYLFGNSAWLISDEEQECSEDQLRLLFLDELEQERERWERLKRKFSDKPADSQQKNRRKPIPESVRMQVWRRDGGKCVECGSNERLEFDHMVPVSKGGSNTARNIQLLCEPCNRKKSARI